MYILRQNNLTLLSHFIRLSHFLKFFKNEETNSFPNPILSKMPRFLFFTRLSLYCPTGYGFIISHVSCQYEAVPHLPSHYIHPRCRRIHLWNFFPDLSQLQLSQLLTVWLLRIWLFKVQNANFLTFFLTSRVKLLLGWF